MFILTISCKEEELSMETKKSVVQEAIKTMRKVLPKELKASVAEILDLDHLDDMDNGIDSPMNMLILIEKEANEDPKLIMLQRFVWPPAWESESEATSDSETEEQPAPVEPNQQHRPQVEPESLTFQTVAVVIAIIAFLIYSIFNMY